MDVKQQKVLDYLLNKKIEKRLILGTVISMPIIDILSRMSEKQIEEMFEENIDVQYILLDYNVETGIKKEG